MHFFFDLGATATVFSLQSQDKQHEVGEVDTYPETGYPKECILAYDGTVQQDWTIDTPTCWKPWHSRKAEYALPWEAPTGGMICTRQESTWYGQTVTRTDASRIPISARKNIRRRGKSHREVKICGAVQETDKRYILLP